MATKPIPPGSTNFPVNMPTELRRVAGRLAYEQDMALGAWIREMICARVAVAYRAGEISREVAQAALKTSFVAVVALGFFAAAAASVLGGNEPRRVGRISRRGRHEFAWCDLENGGGGA